MADANTVKGKLQKLIDDGISVVIGAGSAVIGKVGLQIGGNDVSTSNPINTDVKNVLDASMGQHGGKYSGAATITPDTGYVYVALQIITDAVLTCTGSPTAITSIAFTAGTIIYGRFTQVVIASGTVIAYQGV